jgi:hypothetical protein
VRRLALVVFAGLALAACGSSSHTSTTGDAAAKAQIKSAYEKFFSGNTSLADRVALLENGQKLKPVIQLFATNPLAKRASATVSSVTLQGANKAKVVFTVKLASTSLGTQTGNAVRQNGAWKVGDAGLCHLVALGGSVPSACKP